MVDLKIIFILLFLHFLADFPLQSSWMSNNKSKKFLPLFSHVGVHFLLLSLIGIYFAILNAFLHFIIDFITSRVSSYFWKTGKENLFWIVIGFDQLLHYVCLFGTYVVLNSYGFI
ncbi:MAG: DUF3307 domain-containing protein [Candidatus Gracilibacteria bacterium]|nr:DUF3307 domain-containing protein [Candidatus Gracilibacteria bacterium]